MLLSLLLEYRKGNFVMRAILVCSKFYILAIFRAGSLVIVFFNYLFV